MMPSWISVSDDSDFSLQNLPYGIFSTPELDRRIGVAIGDQVLDLKVLCQSEIFTGLGFDTRTLQESTLNLYAGQGRKVHRKVRALLQELLQSQTSLGHVLRDNQELKEKALVPLEHVQMHLPMSIGDYTDFFTSPYHAQNCTDLVRPGQKLPPSFFKLPIGYGGRSSSIVVSGTPVRRPRGQFVVDNEHTFGPSQKLDFEVEFAAFVGEGNEHGTAIDVNDAEEHIFGLVLLNDWSARDIQRAEGGTLGPLNGKNFCTSISPWIVTLDALEPYRTSSLTTTRLQPYLEGKNDSVHDIPIDAQVQVGSNKYHFSRCNTKYTCFSFGQMLAHHTAGGCPMRPGDLFGTGTLSGPQQSELGCFLEASRDGTQPCVMAAVDSSSEAINRAWLEDGDSVHFTARRRCKDGPGFVGFGSCSGKVISSSQPGVGVVHQTK